MTKRPFVHRLLCVLLLQCVGRANVQAIPLWKQLIGYNQYNQGTITAVHFMTPEGHPEIGLVGTGTGGCRVMRTSDGGKTWTDVLELPNGQITQFAFKSADTGFLTVMYTTLGTPAIYKTVNGGLEWDPQYLFGWASDVHYCGSNMWLVSSRSYLDANQKSMDDGRTWQPFGLGVDQNGFAFRGNVGILSAVSTSYWTSNDYGRTWSGTNGDPIHSWSPVFAPSNGQYYVPEDLFYDLYVGGKVVATFGSKLTGCAQANDCNVFVQTAASIFVLVDGKWIDLHGPGNMEDTRFQVVGTMIYAGDRTGRLFSLDYGGIPWPSLAYSKDSLAMHAKIGCTPGLDSIDFQYPSCGFITIDSAWANDAHYQILSPQLPLRIPHDSTVRFVVRGIAADSGFFPAKIIIRLHTLSFATDTTVPLTLRVGGYLPPSFGKLTAKLTDRCSTLDTFFTIKNNHCDSIAVSSVAMLDTSFVSLGAIVLPARFAPLQSLAIPVHFAVRTSGMYQSIVKIRYVVGRVSYDTTITIHLTVPKAVITTRLSDYAFDYDSLGPCEQVVRSLVLHNTSCDSIQLTSAFINDQRMPSPFELIAPTDKPWLGPGDSVMVTIGCNGSNNLGLDTGFLRLTYGNGAYEEADRVSLRTTFVPSLALVRLSDSSLDARTRSFCAADTMLSLLVRNTMCDTLLCSNLHITGAAVFALEDASDVKIAPRDSVMLHVRVSHAAHGLQNGALHMHLSSTTGLLPYDTLVPLAANMTHGTARLTADASLRDFGTVHVCESRDTTIWILNPGCDTLVVDNGEWRADSGFSISNAFPIVLGPDSAIALHVHFVPDTNGAPSSMSGTLRVLASNSDSAKEIDIPFAARILYPEKDTLHVAGSLRAASAGAGEVVRYYLLLSRSGRTEPAHHAISFSITNDDDLLSLEDATGLRLDSMKHGQDGRATRYYTLLRIPASDTISILTYKVYLAGEETSSLHIGDVHFTNMLGLPNDCVASIATIDTNFTYANGCSDTLIRDMMVTGHVRIDRIVPNPVASLLRVEGSGLSVDDIQVYDVMGRRISLPQPLPQAGGEHNNNIPLPQQREGLGEGVSLNLDVGCLPEGVYYLRAGQASARFEILR